MIDKFEEFVREKVASTPNQNTKENLEAEKKLWLTRLDRLYFLVKESLGSFIDQQLIELTLVETTVDEELLGQYAAPEAHIRLGSEHVKLVPIGTFLIGARGRVDMQGPRGIARFVIVPLGRIKPSVDVRVSINGKNPNITDPSRAATPSPEEWVWKISTPPPRVEYLDLTSETFREALMAVING